MIPYALEELDTMIAEDLDIKRLEETIKHARSILRNHCYDWHYFYYTVDVDGGWQCEAYEEDDTSTIDVFVSKNRDVAERKAMVSIAQSMYEKIREIEEEIEDSQELEKMPYEKDFLFACDGIKYLEIGRLIDTIDQFQEILGKRAGWLRPYYIVKEYSGGKWKATVYIQSLVDNQGDFESFESEYREEVEIKALLLIAKNLSWDISDMMLAKEAQDEGKK